MVQISISWVLELQSAETNIVKSFIVNAKCFVGILNQLVDGESGIVRFNNCVGNLENLFESKAI
jgi:hypothetical protein